MGNGLFATADIKVGEDVVHAKVPFVAVLDTPRLQDTCSGCFGKKQMEAGAELKACTGCRTVKYCDRVSLGFRWCLISFACVQMLPRRLFLSLWVLLLQGFCVGNSKFTR